MLELLPLVLSDPLFVLLFVARGMGCIDKRRRSIAALMTNGTPKFLQGVFRFGVDKNLEV